MQSVALCRSRCAEPLRITETTGERQWGITLGNKKKTLGDRIPREYSKLGGLVTNIEKGTLSGKSTNRRNVWLNSSTKTKPQGLSIRRFTTCSMLTCPGKLTQREL